jgi:hypothetical protein
MHGQTSTSAAPAPKCRSGVRLPLDTVTKPGAYVCNWSGHLLRIPADGLAPDRSLAINIVGAEPLTVTRISDDPAVPLARARGLAWLCGLSPRF